MIDCLSVLFFNPPVTDQKTLSATIDKNTEIGEEVPYQATVENAVGDTETSSEYSYFSFKGQGILYLQQRHSRQSVEQNITYQVALAN